MQVKEKNKQPSSTYWHVILQSTAFFIVSYLFIYVLAAFSLLYIAFDLDIPAKVFTNYVQFGISDSSSLWTTDAIVSVFMSQPVSSFVAGSTALMIYQFYKKPPFGIVALLIWLFLHGFNLTFGLLAEDLIMQTGLARVANVLGLELAVIILTVGIAIFFLWKAGSFAAKMYFLEIDTSSGAHPSKMMHFLSFFLLHYLFGTGILMLISLHTISVKDILVYSFMLICLLPALFFRQQHQEKKQHQLSPDFKRTFFYLAISLFFLILFKITFQNGIYF